MDRARLSAVLSMFLVAQILVVPVIASGQTGHSAGFASGVSDSTLPVDRSEVRAVSNQVSNPCVGTMETRPERTTLLSIQGARGSEKANAMVLGIRPNGSVVGVHNGSANNRWWYYDVDRLANGNLLLSTTKPGISVIEESDPSTGEHVSIREFPEVLDSHDVDLINGDELLVNDMSQDGEDRVFVYNLTREEITWEYWFANHSDRFPKDGGGEYGGDWTHNNDVEQINNGTFMVSVRNFDQVVAINRSTKELEWQLGADGNYTTLNEQHNPDYFTGSNGRPSIIIADSRNDRVVEYARENGTWNKTWVLRGGGLDEPRDADRLPNGNTLVSDRRGDRLLEVTPQGEVVWEFYAPWQPYDAERIGTGDESSGPSARQLNATGIHEMTGSVGVNDTRAAQCYNYLIRLEDGGRLLPSNVGTPTDRSEPATAGTASDPGDNRELPSDESALGTPTPDAGVPTPLLLGGGVLVLLAIVALGGYAFTRRH
ncbi:aryl-sulfate sulfotransferase [Halosimplex aquaticum]|nr:aryl-sulfate sulfotransferase [Halosimplex aquaticum]